MTPTYDTTWHESSVWQRNLPTGTRRSVHARSMHAGRHTKMCVQVGMRSVVHSNMQTVHSTQLTWLRNTVLQMHVQARMQCMQKTTLVRQRKTEGAKGSSGP